MGSAILELGISLFRFTFVGVSADNILAKDPRPPILYLRSFNKEMEKATFVGRMSWWWHSTELQEGHYAFSVESGLSQHVERDITNKQDALKMVGAIIGEFLKTAPFAFKNRVLLHSKRIDALERKVFADLFNRLGPYISIGRPTETFGNMDLGAAKKFVSDDKWQDTIIQWLSKCVAVILEAGDSDGLSWEMRQLVERYEPTRLLIVLP